MVQASPAAYAFGLVRDDRLVAPELLELARKVRRDGEIREVELELPRGPLGGGTLAVQARVAPLGSTHVLLLVEDRTEARRVDAVRRDFVANVSHELKTPVGALSLLAEAVQDAADDPEAVRRFAGRMQHEAMRLSELVQELSTCPGCRGRPAARARAGPIDDVVAEAIDRSPGSPPRPRSIAIGVGGETGLLVRGDDAQLVTALGNLIDNAVAYSPETPGSRSAYDGWTPAGEAGRDQRHRPGDRHPGGRAGAHLRAVLPGRPGPLPGHRRHRPRPGHRQARRHQPRRRGHRVERRRLRLHLHPPAAHRHRHRSEESA